MLKGQENRVTNTKSGGDADSAVSAGPEPLTGLDRVSDAVILLRPEGEVLFVNPAARDALDRLGLGSPDHVRDLPPQLQSAIRATGREAGAGPSRVRELVDGVWAVELPVEKLDPEWLRGMVEAEQMAAVGQLAATVAQEIGGPNTSIQVAIDHLLEGMAGEGKEDEEKVLRQVLRQTQRIARLTRQLIDLADPGRPRLTTVDVNEIADSACELMESSFAERDIRLIPELAPEGVLASADRNHLLQVLVNLLLNARTALQSWTEDRRVKVKTESNGDRVYLHVEDSGPGIPPEDASRIFLPFVSTTGGTGMGLFLTRQILVEQQGGIRVSPRNDMGGATFTINLEKVADD